MQAQTSVQPYASSARDPRFYGVMALATLVTAVAGFGPSYYARAYTGGSPLSAIVHIHAAVFTLWLLLFVVQTMLIKIGRVDIHRSLGLVGFALVPVMLVLGVETAIYGGRNGWNPGGPAPDALGFMTIGLGDILLFSGFAATGLYFRRRKELHKRLMLLAVIGGLMFPAITRIPHIAPHPAPMFGILGLLLLAGPGYDLLTKRRLHAVDVWGGLIIIASFPLRAAIANTAFWHSFALWLIR